MSVDADPLPGAAINFHLLRALDKDSSLPVFANTCADEMALVGIISTQLVHHQFVEQFKMPPPLSESDRVKVRSGLEMSSA